MPEDDTTLDEVRKLAEGIGMTRLSPEHLGELLRATKAARARRASPSMRAFPSDPR